MEHPSCDRNKATAPSSRMSEKPKNSAVDRSKRFISQCDDVQVVDADPDEKIMGDGKSVPDALMNKPNSRRLGQ